MQFIQDFFRVLSIQIPWISRKCWSNIYITIVKRLNISRRAVKCKMQGSSSRFCPSLSSDWRFVCVAKSQTPWVATEMQRKRYFSRGKRCPQRIFKWFGSLPGDAGTWTWRGTRNVATRDDKDTHSVDRQPRWMTAGWANRNGQSCTIYLCIFSAHTIYHFTIWNWVSYGICITSRSNKTCHKLSTLVCKCLASLSGHKVSHIPQDIQDVQHSHSRIIN